ncbi:immunoglobulin-like domain-containing protein [Reichenbachiella sp.]|uniref:immunoglobulin-like domain-containing protein n=1 Tax=Reichenbachiella sp. TaxID=2184521 RepID=UPI003BB16E71
MKNILLALVACSMMLSSCQYFEAQEDTLNVQSTEVPEIKFPSILVNGDNPAFITVGETYEDAGAMATLGAEDISDDMEVVSDVDASAVGVYSVTYSVESTNALGQSSAATATRFVAVRHAVGPGPTLAGNYTSTSTSFGGASFGQTMTVTDNGNGYYSATDVYAHPNADQPANFFDLGNAEVVIEPRSTAQTIFGLAMIGTVTVDPGVTLGMNITFPAIGFSTVKPWDKQ